MADQQTKVSKEIFRSYDVRGTIGDQLTDEVLELIGKAYGTLLYRLDERSGGSGNPNKQVTVGRDVRTTSLNFAAALVRGIASTGIDVTDVGIVPTPTLYFSVGYFKMDGGAVVTASHNPPQFNGLKMRKMIPGGKEGGMINAPLSTEEIQELYQIIAEGNFRTGAGKVVERDVLEAYIDYIVDTVKVHRPLRITLDTGNGATGPTAVKLYEKMGVQVDGLFIEPDGRFPNHVPNPIKPENMTALQERVRETSSDMGIALDGDGDRLGVVDNKGEILWADEYLILLARQALEEHPGATIIYDVKCGLGLIEDIAKHGGKGVMWKTGYTNIFAKRAETGAPLAGEYSGHIFFNDPLISFDDGLYGGARMLSFISANEHDVRDQLSDVPKYYNTIEGRLEVDDKRKFQIIAELSAYFKSKYEVIDLDGVRIVFPDGWALIRASNTEPSLTTRFEGKTAAKLAEYQAIVFDKLKEYPEVREEGSSGHSH